MSEKKITDEEYREALKDMRDEGFVSPPDIIESYISQLKKRVEELETFVRSVATDFDCDKDAHRYDTQCRQCDAQKLISKDQQ